MSDRTTTVVPVSDRDWLARRIEVEAWAYGHTWRTFGGSSGSFGLIAARSEQT